MATISETAPQRTWPKSGAQLRNVVVSKHAAERWAERRMRGWLLDRLALASLRRTYPGGVSAMYVHGKAQFRVSLTERGCVVVTVCDEIEGRRHQNAKVATAIRVAETKKKPRRFQFRPALSGR